MPLISEVAVMVLMPNAPSRSSWAAIKACKAWLGLGRRPAHCRARLLTYFAIGHIYNSLSAPCRERFGFSAKTHTERPRWPTPRAFSFMRTLLSDARPRLSVRE